MQQAKIKFSQTINEDFNDILEDVSGIKSETRYSNARANKAGEGKGGFRFFVPPSHEDFAGLLYNFMGKGRLGNKHREFFERTIVKPLNRAYNELNIAKQSIANDYRALIKAFPNASPFSRPISSPILVEGVCTSIVLPAFSPSFEKDQAYSSVILLMVPSIHLGANAG